MVAGSPVQGLTSWKVSVAPGNGVVVDVAWAKAGPAMSPSSRGTSSKNSFRAIGHSFAYKGQRELASQDAAGKPPSGQQHPLPSRMPRFVRSPRGAAGRDRAWKRMRLDK